jgi:hypothetical protein
MYPTAEVSTRIYPNSDLIYSDIFRFITAAAFFNNVSVIHLKTKSVQVIP